MIGNWRYIEINKFISTDKQEAYDWLKNFMEEK